MENENEGRSASRNLGDGALEGGGCEGSGGSFGSIRRLPMWCMMSSRGVMTHLLMSSLRLRAHTDRRNPPPSASSLQCAPSPRSPLPAGRDGCGDTTRGTSTVWQLMTTLYDRDGRFGWRRRLDKAPNQTTRADPNSTTRPTTDGPIRGGTRDRTEGGAAARARPPR